MFFIVLCQKEQLIFLQNDCLRLEHTAPRGEEARVAPAVTGPYSPTSAQNPGHRPGWSLAGADVPSASLEGALEPSAGVQSPVAPSVSSVQSPWPAPSECRSFLCSLSFAFTRIVSDHDQGVRPPRLLPWPG